MKTRLLLLLFLFVPALALLQVTPAHATTTDPNPYGVTLESKQTNSQTDQSMQWIVGAGLQWTRLQEHWKLQEPTQTTPPTYDFSASDPQVALSVKYGVKVDWALQAPPTWDIQSGCTQVPMAQPMADYAVAVYQHYGSEINSFEVGNEEWSFDGTASCKTPQNYLAVLETVANALRNAGYTGLIGMYGYTNYSSASQITDWFTGFIGDASNPSSYIDYYNFHFYHAGQDPNTEVTNKPAFMDVVNAIHNVAVQYGHGNKPIWVTEFGYNTNCNYLPPGCNVVTPDQQSQYEQEILDDSRTSGIVDHAFVYTLQEGHMAKDIYQDGVPLPAVSMFTSYSQQYPTW